jgi:hypothetical protein
VSWPVAGVGGRVEDGLSWTRVDRLYDHRDKYPLRVKLAEIACAVTQFLFLSDRYERASRAIHTLGTCAIEFADSPLSQYLVTYTPNHIQLRTVAPLRQFQTPHRSPQMSLWELQPHEWQLALSLPIYGRQRKPSAVAIQRRLAL